MVKRNLNVSGVIDRTMTPELTANVGRNDVGS
jgi:hypothetical protein